MLLTSQTDFLKEAKQYKTVPIISHYFADTLTPIQIFQQLEKEAAYLLESNDEQSPWSRYSFIGLSPFLFLKEKNGTYSLCTKEQVIYESQTFQNAFNKAIEYVNIKPLNDLNIPFRGGAVGYVAYDMAEQFEPALKTTVDEKRKEGIQLVFCQTMIAYDHTKKELYIIDFPQVSENEAENEKIYAESVQKIESLLGKMHRHEGNGKLISPPNVTGEVDFSRVISNYNKEQFLQDVKKIKHYIQSGEVEQVVLSQRFETDVTVKGFDIYRVLRMINPSPYLFYIKFDDLEIVGSSPERLVQVQDGHMEIHPIAGTRPRGKTKEEDEALEKELLADKKELLEHEMLIELAKEDIRKVAKEGSVKIPASFFIGRFSHVMHIISKVTGELADGVHPLEAFMAAFPAGTVSGAPKVRAMEIISELEPTKRGIYSGAIGYFGYDGNIDACIAIRTLVLKGNKAYVQAGAGIVIDSVPEREFAETKNKAKALLKAIEVAERMFGKVEKEHVETRIG